MEQIDWRFCRCALTKAAPVMMDGMKSPDGTASPKASTMHSPLTCVHKRPKPVSPLLLPTTACCRLLLPPAACCLPPAACCLLVWSETAVNNNFGGC